jgi:outer membrane lipoprotein carrier protein
MALAQRLLLFLIGLGAALAAGAAYGESAPAAEECDAERAALIATRVQRRYDAIVDLSARFEQYSQSIVLSGPSLGGEEPSRGEVVFAKGGRMRWSYLEPEPSLVVSDGKTMWIYDEAARQVTRLPVQQEYLAGAALQFLLGEGRIDESFRVSALACTAQSVELELQPKQPASYEKLGLIADVETGLVRETTIVDLFGNRTRIRFLDVRLDLGPPDSTFRFEVPSGVEVIDLGPAAAGAKP